MRYQQNGIATAEIDRRLHRNRIILIELHEEAGSQKFISPRNRLVRKGFSFKHFTSMSQNKEGKVYWHLYDYAWMEFSTSDILVVQKSKNRNRSKKWLAKESKSTSTLLEDVNNRVSSKQQAEIPVQQNS